MMVCIDREEFQGVLAAVLGVMFIVGLCAGIYMALMSAEGGQFELYLYPWQWYLVAAGLAAVLGCMLYLTWAMVRDVF